MRPHVSIYGGDLHGPTKLTPTAVYSWGKILI